MLPDVEQAVLRAAPVLRLLSGCESRVCAALANDAWGRVRAPASQRSRRMRAVLANANRLCRWRTAVDTVARSYKFIRFDKNIQQIGCVPPAHSLAAPADVTRLRSSLLRREYSDPDKRPDARLAEELADIHTIMQRNLQEVLNRGEKLESESRACQECPSPRLAPPAHPLAQPPARSLAG